MYERIKISKQKQIEFLNSVKDKSGMSSDELGKICKVTGRTVRDWARAKYTLSYRAALLMSKEFKVPLPIGLKVLKRYWYIEKYAAMGGAARQKRYGLLGNIQTRRKGGLVSQQRRRENPEKYLELGCSVRKQIKPLAHSEEIAELCGILLGDGGITNTQVSVTLNKYVDREYADFVGKLLFKIFKFHPYRKERKSVIIFILSGVNLVEALEKVGLQRGNKVKHQVGIPGWIIKNSDYAKACVRGLVDTDGCVYTHNHISGGKRYSNLGLNFSNHSRPLVMEVYKIFSENGMKSSMVESKGVWIYSLGEVKKYFKIIGSSNPKHSNKLKNYLISKAK